MFLPDEILYSYISGALIKGQSPIFLNPEVPPFGTYIIGLSTLIFSNEYDIIIIFAMLSLLLLFLIGKQVFADSLLALIAPTLFSLEPIFKNQLIYIPLLDIMQLVFLLTIFYLFNKAILTKRNQLVYFISIGVFLGFFIATKFFGTGAAVIGALALPLLFHCDKKRLLLLLLTIPLSIVILYANYFQVLLHGYPFKKFLGIQKWIYLYNSGHLYNPFSVWPLLYFNKWYLWFGKVKVTTDSQWLFTWPILTSISLISILLVFLKKNKAIEVLAAWIVVYLCLLSFVGISSRYFVILIPMMYIVAVYFFQQLWVLVMHNRERPHHRKGIYS